jgi:geranylgeranyl diphosphate synthase type I
MSSVIARVQRHIDAEIARQRALLVDLGPDVADLLDVCESLLRGGKRFRASFLVWGYCSVAGVSADDAPDGVIDLAAAMEFFQAGALIHDDVMDGSDTRRGAPSAHVTIAARHLVRGWLGPADRTGLSGAVLAGNMCLGAAEDLVAGADLPAEAGAAARTMFATMRTQLMAGQYLDVVESARPWDDLPGAERLERADRVIRFKSAKYSVEHPLLIGAMAARADERRIDALSRYGLSVGRAFQLRDDLLGVFGDPAVTGKPAGDDLREGKRTVLVAAALDRLDTAGAGRLLADLGRPEPEVVAALQEQIAGSGAVDWVESRIAALVGEATAALADAQLSEQGYAALTDLADQATRRVA